MWIPVGRQAGQPGGESGHARSRAGEHNDRSYLPETGAYDHGNCGVGRQARCDQ